MKSIDRDGINSSFRFLSVDNAESRKRLAQFSNPVTIVPTIIHYEAGKTSELYEGLTKCKELCAFLVSQKTQPAKKHSKTNRTKISSSDDDEDEGNSTENSDDEWTGEMVTTTEEKPKTDDITTRAKAIQMERDSIDSPLKKSSRKKGLSGVEPRTINPK